MIKIKYSHWLPKLLKVDGVTIGKAIYLKDTTIDTTLIKHELIHVEQYEKHGVLGFLIRYFYHYIKGRLQGLSHWESYHAIPFEIEAYARQNE